MKKLENLNNKKFALNNVKGGDGVDTNPDAAEGKTYTRNLIGKKVDAHTCTGTVKL